MSIETPAMTTVERLKQAIWDLHQGEATEAGAGKSDEGESIMKGTLPRAKYLAGVEQRYLYQRAFERVLGEHWRTDPILGSIVREEQFHAPKAAADIRFLGGDPDRVRPVEAIGEADAFFRQLASENPRLLLGVHYVLEGSNNGARHIARAVRKAYGFQGLDGTRHLDPYEDAQRTKWKEMVDSVNAAEIGDDLAGRMAQSARRAFELLDSAMGQAHERTESARQFTAGGGHDWLREKLRKKLEVNPGLKTAMVADALGVSEESLLRAWPNDGEVNELDPQRCEEIVRQFESLGTLYVVCRTAGCVMETSGRFGGFSRSGPYLNVATDSLHMHIRPGEIGSIFLMERAPGASGSASLSIQFFTKAGDSAFKAFLLPHNRGNGEICMEEAIGRLRDLVTTYPASGPTNVHASRPRS